jgi:catechol 2,3-dioxygenase-like lactoylglutathione lyase family enzyme
VVKRVDTIILLVTDIDSSVDFYKNKIGIPLKFKSPGWAEFILGDVHLALHRKGNKLSGHEATMAAVGVSVNFEVDDIESMFVQLARNGIDPVAEIKDYEFGRYFFVTDPDGYVIGFREYKSEYSPHSSVH